MPSEVVDLPVADVVVGHRARKDAGNVLQLVASIKDVGLLHPIVVNSRNELISGFRRHRAHQIMGRTTIPARVVATLDDALLALKAESDENTCRLDLTPTEILEIGKRIKDLERQEAKGRQGTRTDKHPGKLPEGSTGDTRDKVGAAVGVSGKTYEKMEKVVAAAERDPDGCGDLPAMMDERSVDAAYREMRRRAGGVTGGARTVACPHCGGEVPV